MEILKKNLPNLEKIDLGHPTEFAKETKPSVEKYDNLISTFVDIFVSYAESFECDLDEILGRLTDDDVQDIFKVFKMGNGPTNSERKEELAAQIAQTMFLNGTARTGREHSQATKEKLSKSHTGKKLSDATKAKMSKSRTGKKLSKATRKKISESKIGKKRSEATKEKIRKTVNATLKAKREAEKRKENGGSQKKNASKKKRK
ncbi:hypothetical protein CTEN210_15807 [Chaetoceros tenuissimus]|uniref:Nuclease associated modular domain-containing protein n=1 Tax=Chaetoceros tenuissimus TaxID=426638 RepID=A0AAD3D9U8_9STRA|nr:hypothetical protein CTEN210_15807 [Chaetoceros tenuissimus]